MRFIRDKKILLGSYISKSVQNRILNGELNPATLWYNASRFDKLLLLNVDTSKIIEKLNPKETVDIKEGSSLYFSKASKFPRFKIKDKFKRCIKPEKADAIVVPEINFYNVYKRVVFESDTTIYVAQIQDNPLEGGSDFSDRLTTDEYLIKHSEFFPEKVNFIHRGNVSYDSCGELVSQFYDKDCKFITDKQLDAVVNQTLPEITMDDFKSISDLISSTDTESQVLGLKSLPIYDITPFKRSVNYIISKNYYRLKQLPEWTSVSVSLFRKQLVEFESIDLYSCGRLLKLAESQQDIDFLYDKLTKLIMNRLLNNIDYINGNDFLEKVNKQIKITIE